MIPREYDRDLFLNLFTEIKFFKFNDFSTHSLCKENLNRGVEKNHFYKFFTKLNNERENFTMSHMPVWANDDLNQVDFSCIKYYWVLSSVLHLFINDMRWEIAPNNPLVINTIDLCRGIELPNIVIPHPNYTSSRDVVEFYNSPHFLKHRININRIGFSNRHTDLAQERRRTIQLKRNAGDDNTNTTNKKQCINVVSTSNSTTTEKDRQRRYFQPSKHPLVFCIFCNDYFRQGTGFTAHLTLMHRQNGKLVCPCNKTFNKSSEYVSHENICTQAKAKLIQQMKLFPEPQKECYAALLPQYK